MNAAAILAVVVEGVLLVGAAALLVPVLVLLVQIVSSLRSAGSLPGTVPSSPPRIAVLIPAHNESSGLLATLQSVLPRLRAGDRCVVVADNCDDDTALVAATAGAEVVERFDDRLRGKGYALDFGVRALAADPPDVVVVVDADCLVAADAIARVAALSHATDRPVQALYLITAPPSPKRTTQIAEFAFRVKNWARPLGYHRLGLPCQLMGTGMAFPWPALRSIDLATGHIVEDLKMGLDLAANGHPPLFCPEASVTSAFPSSDAGTRSQRTRWEHGHLSMIAGEVPGLLWRGLRERDASLLAMAFDLLVPPLALLVMVATVFTVVCAIVAAFGLSAWPLVLALLALCGLFVAIALAWVRYGRQVLPLSTLALAPLYALRKIPLYLKFAINRQAEWVRSKRDAG
ncbi:MAG: glycosyltransferase family 2 protein [Burkholderiaceae bacterium]